MTNLLVLLIVVLLIVGALPTWPYSRTWGPYPVGGLVTLLIVLLLLRLIGLI
jgi:hypothetical protein